MGVNGGTDEIELDGANREAFHITVDASEYLPPNIDVFIEKLSIVGLGDGEDITVVDTGSRSSIPFVGGPSTNSRFTIELSGLNLKTRGGSQSAPIAILAGDNGAYRIQGIEFSAIDREEISVTSIVGGSAGSNLTVGLGTGAQGVVSSRETDFVIGGQLPAAPNTAFGITLDAIETVDTVTDLGAKLSDGSIERDSSGRIGVNSGGINESEGISFKLDATDLSPTQKLVLSAVTVEFVNANESFTVVNR